MKHSENGHLVLSRRVILMTHFSVWSEVQFFFSKFSKIWDTYFFTKSNGFTVFYIQLNHTILLL